ncbi:hypothetical protein CP09DC78_1181B, partial [Chlamydia psittaci 09DC78]
RFETVKTGFSQSGVV